MATIKDLGFPAKWLIKYINAELSKYEEIGSSSDAPMMPIFPTSPISPEEVYSNLLQTFPVSEPLMIQWDRLLRFRPNTTHVHKREQLLLFLYTTDMEKLMAGNIIISQTLDREDYAAQDVNKWLSDNQESLLAADPDLGPLNVFFRNMKVFQIDETRDVLELASARTLYVNKLIIEYDYHVADNAAFLESNSHSIKATEHIDSLNN